MTKANVLQLGLLLLLIVLISYSGFSFLGFNNFNAGIASESLLILGLIGWVLSYFFRVISGRMTFVEQRKRYREKYDKITEKQLLEKFDSMTNDEKTKLFNDFNIDKNDN